MLGLLYFAGYVTLIAALFLLIQAIRLFAVNRYLSTLLHFFAIFAWLVFTLFLIYGVILIGMNHASHADNSYVVYLVSFIHTFVGAILSFVSYKVVKKRTIPVGIKNSETSLLDMAKNAYVHRDYEQAYRLFCQVETAEKLDKTSQKFKEQAKQRAHIADEG